MGTSTFRFIHCSDLHLDTPFSGLAAVHPKLKEKLHDATFQAFQNIVDLALREQVDAALIAGDIYDSSDKSLQAQLKFRAGLKKLSDAGIPSFVVRGNHDPLDSWSASLEWPERVTFFSGNEVECVAVNRAGKPLARIHGISFPQRKVEDNLAERFGKDESPEFAVGVLHTNVGGSPGHENYAPCRIEHLLGKGMDYWALGHIHNKRILRDYNPAIVYCGNSQARSFKEKGERGCYLVTLHKGAPPDIRFVATDAVRYHSANLDLSNASSIEDVLQTAQSTCEQISAQMEGRDALLRLHLTGRSPIHFELRRPGTLEGLMEEIHEYFEGRNPAVWVDLDLQTQGIYDIDSLKRGNDFIADILSLCSRAEEDARLEDLRTVLQPVHEDWQGQLFLENPSREQLLELLGEARGLLLDRLMEDR